MINGFQTQTEPLTDYERNTLLPVICRGLVTKVGEAKAITNTAITKAMRGAGYQLTEARLRKIPSGFLGVYDQQWHCWVIWQFYFQFFKESPHCSP